MQYATAMVISKKDLARVKDKLGLPGNRKSQTTVCGQRNRFDNGLSIALEVCPRPIAHMRVLLYDQALPVVNRITRDNRITGTHMLEYQGDTYCLIVNEVRDGQGRDQAGGKAQEK